MVVTPAMRCTSRCLAEHSFALVTLIFQSLSFLICHRDRKCPLASRDLWQGLNLMSLGQSPSSLSTCDTKQG